MYMDSTVPLSGKEDVGEFYLSPLDFLNLNLLLCYESKWQKNFSLHHSRVLEQSKTFWVSLRYIID